jgi:type VI secretion system secreted protein Hcp
MGESWYMQIDGIEGGSVAKGFEEWIEVDAYTWDVTAASSSAGRGAGGRTGRVTYGNLVVTAPISVATPRIVEACALARRVSKVVLSGLRVGDDGMPSEFLSYELGDVIVMSVRHRDDLDVSPTEQIELAYQRMEITYTPQDGRGGAGQPVTTVLNRAIA